MKKNIIKIILVGSIFGILIFGIAYLWEHRYEYFFQGESFEISDDINKEGVNKKSLDKIQEIDNNNQLNSESDDVELALNEVDGEKESVVENNIEYTSPDVTDEDCKKECENFEETAKDYEYCREICGLNEIQEGAIVKEEKELKDEDVDKDEDACEDDDGILQEDICWKEKAVEEKDANYCGNISDDRLSIVCENRVLEEIMN